MIVIALRLLAVFALAVPLAKAAMARELASAPYAEPIGFSSDRRYFAYEQYYFDDLSEEAIMAVDVIDRTTGRSADGFPIGLLGWGPDGEYPARLGSQEIVVDEALTGMKLFAMAQEAVRAAARPELERLAVLPGYRRLAGNPVTDRAPATYVDFVHHATLEGAVPDMQETWRLSARIEPNGPGGCMGGGFDPSGSRIVVDAQAIHPHTGELRAIGSVSIPWDLSPEDCPLAVRITDVVTVPYGREDPLDTVTAVMVLATSTGPHAESARYFARFLQLP